jgi:2'-5' RNA ligase
MRTFIALALDPMVRDRLVRVREQGWIRGRSVRWVKEQSMHLTLKFLGEIEPATVPDVTCAIQKASEGIKPFELEIRGLGFFPNPKRPRVFWAGVAGQLEALEGLHGGLEQALSSLGFEKENRPFSAHLTLARFRGRDFEAAGALGGHEESFGTQTVEEIVLFKSELRPQGPRYTPLSVTPLEE